MKVERTVSLTGLLVMARIGVYDFEKEKDHPFVVNVALTMACELTADEVSLNETIDYEEVLAIVQAGMKAPELLLETVANSIVLKLQQNFPFLSALSLEIHKKNPPLKAEVESSSVKLIVLF